MARWIYLLAVLALSPAVVAGESSPIQQTTRVGRVKQAGYFLEDYQYYKPMIGDIRDPHNHMRFYRDDALTFTDSTDNLHRLWDVSFGENFPLFGFDFSQAAQQGALRRPGIAFFIDGAAHMLLDFDAPSSAVINTDFRVGGGVSTRLWLPFNCLSLRYRYFHESTHLGDEYTLLGVSKSEVAQAEKGDDKFRRYNVSYEAHELYGAIDRYAKWKKALKIPLLARPRLSYARAYTGVRRMKHTSYTGVDSSFTSKNIDPLLASSKYEYQVGGELFFRGWRPAQAKEREGASWLSRLLAFQYFVMAADLYQRDQYDVTSPERRLSTNITLGVVYGGYFEGIGDEGQFEPKSKSTVRWLLNYYNGVNPHGQFRQEKLEYVGFDFVIDF